MPLSLDTREVGRVTIVHCNGRIVAGSASDSLREHVAWLLRDRRSIVLHLGEVGFIDSSGLGTMVRALTSTRQAHGDLKLCNVPEFVRKVLEMSRLTTVFDAHDSEEKAVAAFYRPGARAEAPVPTGRSVLCLDSNADVLAYLRELLRRAGYDVQSSGRVADALLLMRVTHFDLLLVGPDMTASPASPPAFRDVCARLPVIELGSEFSTSHAGEAAAGLLEAIADRLNPKTSDR
ncbi:MAG TPA: anti-sigma factor antagonist [Terriglobales bacterium]|nr:anti-sigma factor antagonist [Terriglobales bacterium]